MAAPTSANALPSADSGPGRFYCAEVWGGNGGADQAIEVPGARGWLYSQPCDGGRGGDIHYVSLCNSGLISRLCLADVAGHGESIAAVGGEIHGLLRRFMNSFDQRSVLSALNDRLTGSDVGVMTTAIAVTYFPPSRYLSISTAGHPPARLRRARTRTWTTLERADEVREDAALTNLPLAIASNVAFSRRNVRVRTGDRLLLLTDGVLEAFNAAGEAFGDLRLDDVIEQSGGDGPRELVHTIVEAHRAHLGDAPTPDDMTILVMDFERGPALFGVGHALRRLLFGRPRHAVA